MVKMRRLATPEFVDRDLIEFLRSPVLEGENEVSLFRILMSYFEFLKNENKFTENRFSCEKLAEIIEKRDCEKVIDYIDAIEARRRKNKSRKCIGRERRRVFGGD